MSLSANYVPYRNLITDVTQASNAVITTADAHGYETGQWVRIIVPLAYQMEINYLQTKITVTSDTEFETEIDTRSLLPFSAPSAPPAFTQAQTVPISGTEDNLG